MPMAERLSRAKTAAAMAAPAAAAMVARPDAGPRPAGTGPEPSGKPDRPAKPAAGGKSRRLGGRAKGKKVTALLTPEQVIRQRRRRCSDAQDIASFFTKLIAIAVMLAVLFGVAFGITPMANDDMAPRISAGDLLLYYRLADDWSSGDVMVFEKDGEQYVGRIVARGGDTVEVTEQATLVVNGSTVLESDIYYTTPKYESDVTYPLTLAQDEFFVLCDYREGARDSRYFGPVKASEVKGKVITVVRRSDI